MVAAGRLAPLDGLRGFGVLMILIYHFYSFAVLVVEPGHSRIDRITAYLIEFSWTTVDLFFVLSGFLITSILLEAKEKTNFFRFFYARRFLRVFPLYYLFLLVVIFVIAAIPALRDDRTAAIMGDHQWWYWGYLVNVWLPIHGYHLAQFDQLNVALYGNSQFWSLAVEEQFYLVWPAVVFLTGRRGLIAFCLICIFGSPLIRAGLAAGAIPGLDTQLAPYMLAPARLDGLAMGGLIAAAARSPEMLAMFRRWAPAAFFAGAAALISLAFARGGLSPYDLPVQMVGLSITPIMYGGLITLAVTSAPERAAFRICAAPFLTFFGRYSYGLYIVHVEMIILLSNQFGRNAFPAWFGAETPGRLLFAFIGISCSLAFALVSWNLYEKQFLKLKSHFEHPRTRPAPQAPAAPPLRVDDPASVPTR
jgi:peptidoglycan/LPS O-acetylase OafA/YrhL